MSFFTSLPSVTLSPTMYQLQMVWKVDSKRPETRS